MNDVADAENVVKVRQSQVLMASCAWSRLASGGAWWSRWRWSSAQQNPGVTDLSFEDRYTDLVASGIDVALRPGKLADSSLGARTLGVNPGRGPAHSI